MEKRGHKPPGPVPTGGGASWRGGGANPGALDALRPLVVHLPPEEQEAAARRLLRYLELVMEIVDEEDGLTAPDEGSTLSYSV